MRLYQIHVEGGILFMSILFFLLVINLVLIVKSSIDIYFKKRQGSLQKKNLEAIKFIGSFALAFGIFGQIIGLFEAFKAIEKMGEVSQALLAGGLKVSSFTTIYGFFIFLLSSLCWFILNRKMAV